MPQPTARAETLSNVVPSTSAERDAVANHVHASAARQRWLWAGLGLSTLATLLLEILDTRLLSVVTWYHISFLAVSLAMLGMAAGAVRVFLGGDRFRGEAVLNALPRYAIWLAILIPVSHLLNLVVPVPLIRDLSFLRIASVALATTVLAIPFVVSGIVVTLALTRTGGRIGFLYAADLLGAAAGCLLVIALLNVLDLTSATFASGAVAALGAYCFEQYRGGTRGRTALLLVAGLTIAAVVNGVADPRLGVIFAKGRRIWPAQSWIEHTAWNTHSFVMFHREYEGGANYWAGGRGSDVFKTRSRWILIDGEAGTAITRWDGDPATLEWTAYDVTSAPYHLRRGNAAVIGVGGGRDLLSALWGRNATVTGIEINGILVDALEDRYRDFAKIADAKGVTIVHDEARSYLRRQDNQYDVLQMSLVDTWAATGAGAFTLTENGLYTRDGWRVFLNALTPTGVFSVSRWFSPGVYSETTRLLALGTSALLERGISKPADHLILLANGSVATLMVSPSPFTDQDRRVVSDILERFGFVLLAAPWQPPADERLRSITGSTSFDELGRTTTDDLFDFTPPSDARPFFFNMLKPAGFFETDRIPHGGVMEGNVRATATLIVLLVTASLLVAGIVVWPLIAAGRPDLPKGAFGWALVYFSMIGGGYMLIQIALLQRFSVFLGHPTYTFAIILFSMILATGIGSFFSERLDLSSRALWIIGPVIAVVILALTFLVGPVIERTGGLNLAGRSAVVLAFTTPLSIVLGFCFPIGMRLLGRVSDQAAAWMWGVNGGCGVLASILAVAISMWVGIHANLFAAAVVYALLLLPMRGLAMAAADHGMLNGK